MTRDYWTRWRLPPKISKGFLVALPLLFPRATRKAGNLTYFDMLHMCSRCCQVGQKVLLFSAWGGTTCARPWKRNHWDAVTAVTKCKADIPKWATWASTSQPHAALNAAMERSCKECGDLQRCRKMLQKNTKKTQLYLPISSVASKSITCQGTRHPKQKACCSARRSQHFSGTNAATSLPDKI